MPPGESKDSFGGRIRDKGAIEGLAEFAETNELFER